MFNTLCHLSQSVSPFKRMERRTARTNTYCLDYFASFAPLISRLSRQRVSDVPQGVVQQGGAAREMD